MHDGSIIFSIFLIFTGAAVFATIALYARQALIIGYILLGVLAGPWGLRLISDLGLIQEIAEVGIIFLLFLLGLNLYPQKLVVLLKEATVITGVTSLLFAALGWAVAYGFGFGGTEAAIIGVATMFSSTIIGLKLLPTTVLHHRHAGEIIISVLLLQDLLAIITLLVLHGLQRGDLPWLDVGLLLVGLPLLVAVAYLGERLILLKLIQRFDKIQEYIFLLALGWCLGIAELSNFLGLSYEIGAFVAGIAVATSPISRFIAESLKPLRDFFLVMFFFALGAGLNLGTVSEILVPALVLTALVLTVKPLTFKHLLIRQAESPRLAWEIGWRLGQMSEFSLLIAFAGLSAGLITPKAGYLIQLATVLTLVGSSYLIVLRYPTPIAVSERLRRD